MEPKFRTDAVSRICYQARHQVAGIAESKLGGPRSKFWIGQLSFNYVRRKTKMMIRNTALAATFAVFALACGGSTPAAEAPAEEAAAAEEVPAEEAAPAEEEAAAEEAPADEAAAEAPAEAAAE